jgi:hypothetical protein
MPLVWRLLVTPLSKPRLYTFLLAATLIFVAVSDGLAQQCRVTGPTCSEAKAQCRQIRKRVFPGKSNNPCANRFRRCMAEGRYVTRNCNVPMQKSQLARPPASTPG